jgi:hypothetical protein
MSYNEADAVRLVRPKGVKDVENIILEFFDYKFVGSSYE